MASECLREMGASRMQSTVPAQGRKSSDDAHVRIVNERGIHRGQWFLAAAVALVLAALIVIVRPFVPGAPGPVEPRRDDASRARPESSPPRLAGRQAAPRRQAGVPRAGAATTISAPQATAATPGSTAAAPEAGSAPPASTASDRPADGSGEAEGIALFPPPGTDPPKPGIIVPEDFELPPGFVRHYQVTDDGKDLPAILMFHPDHNPVDATGNPVPLPDDRIVPPEMAPPGMPIQILEVPPDTVPMIEVEPPGFRDAEGEATEPAGEE